MNLDSKVILGKRAWHSTLVQIESRKGKEDALKQSISSNETTIFESHSVSMLPPHRASFL